MTTCSIDGCGKPTRSRGWCNSHWHRWQRHGDPLAGSTAHGAPGRFFRETVIPYEGDECLTWPFARKGGYGLMWIDDVTNVVSRLACEAINGSPPSPKHHAAHNCGKGNLGCVNPRHMEWKTPVENHADKLVHGTRSRGETHGAAKLTEADVVQIQSMRGTRSLGEIATQFGVSRSAVSLIHVGKNWGHVS